MDEGKISYPLVLWLQVPCQKSVVVLSMLILAQADQVVLSLNNQLEGMNLRHCHKSRLSMLVAQWLVIFPCHLMARQAKRL